MNFLTFANPYFVDRTGPAVQKLIHVCDFEEVETILEISEVKSSFEGDCTCTSWGSNKICLAKASALVSLNSKL